MVHRIVVEDQSLRWYGRPPKIADNSIEFVRFQFHLPEDWDPLVLVAQFTQANTYNMLLYGDTCFLPKELTAGLCKLSLFGYTGGKPLRATSIPLAFQIEESGFVSSAETPIPPTPDLYAQLIEYFSSIAGSGSGTINPEDIAAAVEDYLSKNPPEPGAPGEPGKPGEDGDDGGYYTPSVSQPDQETVQFDFNPSKPDMPAVASATVKMPKPDSGGNAENGEDGFSPIATVTQTDSGAVISITDKDGTTTATITNGKDGKDGVDGADGEPGQPGEKGDKGDPGDDYVLTDADKAEIAEMAAGMVEVPEGSGGNVDFVVQDTPPEDTSVLWVDPTDEGEDAPGGIAVTGAKVGQTVKIAEVDENGVPTAWVAVDFPSEGEFELIEKIVADGTVNQYTKMDITLKEVEIYIQMEAAETAASCGVEIKNDSALFGYSWMGNLINTGKRYAYVHGVSNGFGNAYIEATAPSTTLYTANTLNRTPSKYDGKTPIKSVNIYGSGGAKFPAGSTIEIWGVRA